MSEIPRLTDAQLEALERAYETYQATAAVSYFQLSDAEVRSFRAARDEMINAVPGLLSELRTLRAQVDAQPSVSDWSGFDTALDTLQSRAEDTSARLDAAFWSGSEE